MKRKQSAETASTARQMRREGVKVKDIALALGLSQATIYATLKAAEEPEQEKVKREKVKPDPATIKETCVYALWFAKRAVALGCAPDKALDAVASAGLVKMGGRAV